MPDWGKHQTLAPRSLAVLHIWALAQHDLGRGAVRRVQSGTGVALTYQVARQVLARMQRPVRKLVGLIRVAVGHLAGSPVETAIPGETPVPLGRNHMQGPWAAPAGMAVERPFDKLCSQVGKLYYPAGTLCYPAGTLCCPVGTLCCPVGTPCSPVGTPCSPVDMPGCPVGTLCCPVGMPCSPAGTLCHLVDTPFPPADTVCHRSDIGARALAERTSYRAAPLAGGQCPFGLGPLDLPCQAATGQWCFFRADLGPARSSHGLRALSPAAVALHKGRQRTASPHGGGLGQRWMRTRDASRTPHNELRTGQVLWSLPSLLHDEFDYLLLRAFEALASTCGSLVAGLEPWAAVAVSGVVVCLVNLVTMLTFVKVR